jgi:hypothetical protein
MLTHSSDSFLAQHQAQVEEGGGGLCRGVWLGMELRFTPVSSWLYSGETGQSPSLSPLTDDWSSRPSCNGMRQRAPVSLPCCDSYIHSEESERDDCW